MLFITTCQKICVCVTIENSCSKIRNASVIWTTSEPRVTLSPSTITNNCVIITGVSVGSAIITATITVPGLPVVKKQFIVVVSICIGILFNKSESSQMPIIFSFPIPITPFMNKLFFKNDHNPLDKQNDLINNSNDFKLESFNIN